MTQEELGRRLGLSLSGTKKIFQKSDIGLERFAAICRILDLDPRDAMDHAAAGALKVKALDEDVDAYLAAHPQAFRLYWLLAVERMNVSTSLSTAGIPRLDGYRMLRKLDDFGLIIWRAGDRVSLPDKVPFVFQSASVAALTFARERAHALVDEASAARAKREKTRFLLRYLAVPAAEAKAATNELESRVHALSTAFPYAGKPARKKAKAVPLRVLLCIARGDMPLG
jgi:hypothetical protein